MILVDSKVIRVIAIGLRWITILGSAILLSCTVSVSEQLPAEVLLLGPTDVPDGWTQDWLLTARDNRTVADDLPPGAVDLAMVNFRKASKGGSTPNEFGQIVWNYQTPSLAAQHFRADLQPPADAMPGTELGLHYSSLKADSFRIYCQNRPGTGFRCTAQARYGSYVYSMSGAVQGDDGLTTNAFLNLVMKIEAKMNEMP